MSIHADCLAKACKRLGIAHSFVAGDKNFLRVDLDRRYYFPGASTPFNDSATSKICRDKEFAYKLLKDVVSLPKTLGFVDPNGPAEYSGYARAASTEEITDKFCAEFALPFIVKRNSGSQGQHVFLCKTRAEVTAAVATVFDKEPRGYDHVVLAQEYIKPRKEYRVIVFRKEILLAYAKDTSGATFTGNLSPLHWEDSKAVHVTDQAWIARMREFIAPIYGLLDLNYGGLDIIEDAGGALRLVEINSRPGFSYFVRDNGREPLVKMYETILAALSS